MNKHTLATAALLLTAALTLTACGGDDATTASQGGSSPNETSSQTEQAFNDADITFAQQMVPHHTQAVEMAQLAEDRAESPEVKQLAADIEAAQGPEIEQLTTWLEEWGAETASGSESDSGGHGGHGDSADEGEESSEMSGMMSEDDMVMLEDASGAEFDRMFLEMMVEHHRGAVAMAETEVADGEHPDAVAMAKQIISTQEAEIQQMQQLLSS